MKYITKKRVIIVVSIVVILIGINSLFIGNGEEEYSLAKVTIGTVSEEVSEVGAVKRGEKINLTFKNTGRVEKIYVEVGDTVGTGQRLAKYDTTDLYIKREAAKATLGVAKANLNKLIAGSSKEEIKLVQTTLANAKVAYKDALMKLEDVKNSAKESLDNAYGDALNTLDTAYLKSYNASNNVSLIQRTYFWKSDQESTSVKESKFAIETSLSQIKYYVDTAKASPTNENVDSALSKATEELSIIYDEIGDVREMTEDIDYRDLVSVTHKGYLDTDRSNINTVLISIINDQQTISSTKIVNTANINTAQAAASTAKGAVDRVEDELAIVVADPRQADIDLYQAKVDEAQASVDSYNNQVQEAILFSPTNGEIAEIHKRVGEIVQAAMGDDFISLLPISPFEIEVDIYEEDIAKMEVGNPVDIIFVAFSDVTFTGKIISINPAEKVKEGIVYYETIIDFDEEILEGVRPGMTADLIIKTALREDVLTVSDDAIWQKNGKKMVEVYKNGNITEREIEIGLDGTNDLVEIISGLEEGEEVVLK